MKLWSEGYKCTKKGIFCRTESVAMTPKSCAHMRTTSLWGVAAKASLSYKDEADTWPKRPTRIQLYQFEPVRQDSQRVPEHRVSSRIARIGNTDWQVSHFPHHRWSCTGRPFVLRWVDWSVSFDQCFFVFTQPLDQTWLIHDRTSVKLNFTFFWVMWLNHQRVTICFI